MRIFRKEKGWHDMRIQHLRTCHLENPIGFQITTPVFSWIVEDEDTSNMVSKISVSGSDGTYVETDFTHHDSLGTKIDMTLQPRTRYTWKVSIKKEENVYESEEAFFETGKREETWNAKWVREEQQTERLPIFYKQLSIDKPVASARLYICGLGLYEAYIGGEKIGDALLTPGCNDYTDWIQVQTYDITKEIQKEGAQPELSVLLGDGWYKGRYGFTKYEGGYYGKTRTLIAEVHVVYEDGSIACFGTDETWSMRRSNILAYSIYDGEKIDDTLPIEEGAVTLLEEAEQVRLTDLLTDNFSVPVRKKEEFAVEIIKTPLGELVLDTKQNLSGVFSLKVKVPKQKEVRLQFGEVLQDGNFYRDNLRGAKQEFVYISDGDEHVVRPHFTFYGFRYIKIEGIEQFEASDLTVHAIYSDIQQTGTLTTGHDKVNQLISNTIWGMKSNFVDIPTDCPQRDERMGWTGDAQAFSATAMYLADTYAFYRKFLYDCKMEQKAHEGMVPDTIPAAGMKGCSSVWGDATCIIPWNMYLFYGDKTILEEHYDSMVAWIEYIRKVDGDHHGYRKIFHYGDWLALDSHSPGVDQVKGGTDEGFIADVYYRKSALLVAKAAELLGKEEDVATYQKLADDILEGILYEYYTPSGRCAIETQTAAILSLLEGIGDRERAKNKLHDLLEANNGKLKTGFVGTPFLCPMLSEHGMEQMAWELLFNEEYPGWLSEVNLGATTIWERWNSLDENGHISSTGMNSLNHYTYGSIVEWIWKYAAGLRPLEEEPGFRKVRIEPSVSWKLRFLDAEYLSSMGTYIFHWDLPDQEHIHVKITVPKGCEALVQLPYTEEAPFVVSGETIEKTYQINEQIM